MPPCVKVGCERRWGAEGLNDSYSYFAQARVERFPWSFAPSLSFSLFALQKQHFYQNIVTAPRDGHTPRSQALCAF